MENKIVAFRDVSFKLLDFKVSDEDIQEDEEGYELEDTEIPFVNKRFLIQIFGLDERGKKYSVFIEDFHPYFFVQVSDEWTSKIKNAFVKHLQDKNRLISKSILHDECCIVKRHKLYGFDNHKYHKFVKLVFKNQVAYNRIKNMFYMKEEGRDRRLNPNGYIYNGTKCMMYETNIPPLLRFFHLRDISPSGWVKFETKDAEIPFEFTSTLDYEYMISYTKIFADNTKEAGVPYNICSFDIEASSSHGDFPVAVKNYKRLVVNMLDYYDQEKDEMDALHYDGVHLRIAQFLYGAFGFEPNPHTDIVYPIRAPTREQVQQYIEMIKTKPARKIKNTTQITTIASMFQDMIDAENEDAEQEEQEDIDILENKVKQVKHKFHKAIEKTTTFADIWVDTRMTREEKMLEMCYILDNVLPKLKGDQITYIGSVFWKYGQKEAYRNHCLVLGNSTDVPNAEIVCCKTEKELILKWSQLIQEENPDIITGYNIFGFDYKFMYYRAKENKCLAEFLKLSRNKDEICGTWNQETASYDILESSITLASGTYNLSIIRMNGRIQIDMFNYFRREYTLPMYELDYVSGYFIGDKVSQIVHKEDTTTIKSKNLSGLQIGNFVNFEETSHSTDYYENGRKYEVVGLGNGEFTIQGIAKPAIDLKIVKWCLAKDDVTPQDIFRMWKGSNQDRAMIAKYCIQDCMLVHHLIFKIDVITGYVEMAKICSVPLDFLVMRGQGIKLFSFVAKECMKKETLIPVMEKKKDGGYEGAIVLPPKCGLYIDEPVACVDYSSLYPSSMISENLSHDSKVWTKEYNLRGELVRETGEKVDGVYIYDNLPQYKYVDVQYDAYEYRVLREGGKAEKIKVGYKICRWVQLPNGENSIIPSILKELLFARKYTRTIANYKTVKTPTNHYVGLVDDMGDTIKIVLDKTKEKVIVNKTDIIEMFSTHNDFMQNVLDKRQLAIKVTANSVYGQCGAITSPFYEKDVAASTTAIGRKLLIYGKSVIESVYGDRICNTSYGMVHTHAEYIYGDSVADYTPIYIRRDGKTEIIEIKDLANEWKQYGDKEACEMDDVETWTERGWTKLERVIRHRLSPHKKMWRISTGRGIVDVTDDHSLLDIKGNKISPKEIEIGTELLHHSLPDADYEIEYLNEVKDQLTASKICLMFQSWGLSTTIEYAGNTYYITLENSNERVKKMEEIEYDGYVYDLTTENHHFAAGIGNIIVHNTDSVFMSFKLTDLEGNKIRGKEALKITIELAKEAGHLATKFLKPPHDLEYEKTFMPFCLLSKKRYVGMLYVDNDKKCYRKSMGIVLKRRDNAPIVKDVYGGIIDILMSGKPIQTAIDFTKQSLKDLVSGKVGLDKLIITKSLKGFYKNPNQIAHKVLADRIAKRDAGNKIGVGDRVPFVYIQTPATKKKVLQGEKVEHPDYIIKNKLKPDYEFYITRQLMKPIQQIYALVLEEIPSYDKEKLKRMYIELRTYKKKNGLEDGDERMIEKEKKLRDGEVQKFLFDDILNETIKKRTGQRSVFDFLGKTR
jgi:DNA polymerase elongation subunit (family B)